MLNPVASATEWAFSWNAPRPAIASPFPTYDEIHQREKKMKRWRVPKRCCKSSRRLFAWM